ncbi:hypothetical protein AVEN_202847-1 [Araneus ventricosus]|uniref:Uncharacterized protein n=1 Tax=Araneus ventricosus TaxID=182803 RepID=A0A4Y2DLL2_ARAVE|nr:hypothetical protein AVEN_202847-1 [Araneus ventricosus]
MPPQWRHSQVVVKVGFVLDPHRPAYPSGWAGLRGSKTKPTFTTTCECRHCGGIDHNGGFRLQVYSTENNKASSLQYGKQQEVKFTLAKATRSQVYSTESNKESSLHYRKQQGVKFTVRKATRSQVYSAENNKESSLQCGKQQELKFTVRIAGG